ncbi:MAG: DNA polymerase domain-containing protein [Candidatus Aenigmatarchaeota archaeon]
MNVIFQLLDTDYVLLDNKVTIRMFGKTEDGKSICVFYDDFLPYFYVLPKKGKENEVLEYVKSNFKEDLVNIENISKFLPIGYYDKKTELIKITIKNPSRTPFIRDNLKNKGIIDDVFEGDILFKYRFMADHRIFGMRWYRADGDYTQTNSVKTERKFKAKKITEVDKEENSRFKYMSFDIETLVGEGGLPDADKEQIILISMCFYPSFRDKNSLVLSAKRIRKTDNGVISFENEKEMLKEFVNIIEQFDPDIILGYNINNFDLPYLNTRLKKNGIDRTLGRCHQKPMMVSTFMGKSNVSIVGRICVDVYSLVKEGAEKFGLFKGLKRYGLGDVSEQVLGEGKVDVAHSEISKFWNGDGEQIEKLIEYSRKDAELPLRILFEKRMLDKFIEISKVSGLILQDCLDKGESERIDNLLLREFNKRDFVIPCKPDDSEVSRRNVERGSKGLKGAFVLEPDTGFHDTCVAYLDFKSMYPSIVIGYNICPTTLLLNRDDLKYNQTPFGSKFVDKSIRVGIFPEILKNLLEARDKIKKEMKKETDSSKKNYLHAKQYAFKTVANAFYGYSGYIRARFYVLDIASGITSVGREMINKTREIVDKKTPYKVIYGDTDSVMVKLKTKDVEEAYNIGKEIADIINSEIKILQIKIESIFKTVLLLAKKRYAAWSFEPVENGWQEEIITKGIETVRRDWCDLVSETLEKVLNTILREQDVNKAVKIVKDTVNDIKTGKVEIDKLVITKSVSRSLKSYKGVQPHVELVKKMKTRDPTSAPGVGDRVGYVIVKGTQMISMRAEDPEFVKKNKVPIDSKYYIESQLLPPLERVFEALKVNKSELMGIGKQIGIFEIINNNHSNEFEESFDSFDGFICNSCGNVYRRPPLTGKCNSCGGELVFKKGDKKSRNLKIG